MYVKKLIVKNFQGLRGQKEYDLGPVVALFDKNGRGKTSFIQAYRYVLTGVQPQGRMLSDGEPYSAVGAVLDDGTYLIRQDNADGKHKFFINRKPVQTKKAYEAYLEQKTGIRPDAMRAVSSGELLASMDPKAFSDLLLSYLPEELTGAFVKEAIDQLTPGMEKILNERLPHSFGTHEIGLLYKECYTKRRELNARVSALQAVVSSLAPKDGVRPIGDKNDLEIKRNALREKLNAELVYKTEMTAYTKAMQAETARKAQLKEIDAKIVATSAVKPDEEKRLLLVKQLETCRKAAMSANAAAKSMEDVIARNEEAIKKLSSDVCPLSNRIRCSTDKTPALSDLEQAVQEAKASIKKSREAMDQSLKDAKETEEAIRQFDTNAKNWEMRLLLIQQKQRLEQAQPLPKEPVKPETAGAEEEMKRVEAQMRLLDSFAEYKKQLAAYTALKQERDDYDLLVRALGANGPVKAKIIDYYLAEFERQCNESASELHPGMSVKFVQDGGIRVKADIRGNGTYLEYNALSGGERALLITVLLEMLNALTGFNTLILDELSVLDADTFEALIALVVKNKDRYGQVVMAAVNHSEFMDVLHKYEVPVLTI